MKNKATKNNLNIILEGAGMSVLRRKKGSIAIKQWFLIFAVLAAAAVSLGIYYRDVQGAIKGKTFEKNYFARDLGLFVDTVYSSPGELSYTYPMRGYELKITIRDRKVTVVEPGGSGIETVYRYADVTDVNPPDFEEDKPEKIVFIKTPARLEAKRG